MPTPLRTSKTLSKPWRSTKRWLRASLLLLLLHLVSLGLSQRPSLVSRRSLRLLGHLAALQALATMEAPR